mmetsp:Transcript_32873/g.82566  ORF Transcript_32873/g.82566 Transcript_32873/m.82566 type:complete len:151 (+) Transcript_32873:135-587(+)|eukprot:CAMPEP_0177660932 /NCGR_PEP_ID=MMETSP0447-20121125/18350_1 /TAXON_ID=0 /ORGANISM="Stygamoeba regulata, Strain BSH-02190019" /LENGTH=150 /DNA_ID=CAMNT_0019166123 /DNA_START=106 /DNA_END=558 /DNA_ORIENTATION=+
MSLVIELSKEYLYVVLTTVLMCIELQVFGVFAGVQRKKYGGLVKYPDNGYGRWADKLNEKDWISFANYQRVHYNMLEGITGIVLFTLVAGIFFPFYAAIFGAAYVVGRAIYAVGYWSQGAQGRTVGAIILDVGLVANVGMALYGLITAVL